MASKVIKSAQDRQWEIEDAMRTLQRAETIKNDKFLMGGVKKEVAKLSKMMTGAPVKSKKK